MLDSIFAIIIFIVLIAFCICIIVKEEKNEKQSLKIKKTVSFKMGVFIIFLSLMISAFISNSFINNAYKTCEDLECIGVLGVIFVFPIVLIFSVVILYNLLKK